HFIKKKKPKVGFTKKKLKCCNISVYLSYKLSVGNEEIGYVKAHLVKKKEQKKKLVYHSFQRNQTVNNEQTNKDSTRANREPEITGRQPISFIEAKIQYYEVQYQGSFVSRSNPVCYVTRNIPLRISICPVNDFPITRNILTKMSIEKLTCTADIEDSLQIRRSHNKTQLRCDGKLQLCSTAYYAAKQMKENWTYKMQGNSVMGVRNEGTMNYGSCGGGSGEDGLKIQPQRKKKKEWRTKFMPVGSAQDDMLITVPGQAIEQVQQFTYLGSILCIDGGTDEDINHPTGMTCTTKKIKRLNVFQQRSLRRILHISYRDHITNEEVLQRSGLEHLSRTVDECLEHSEFYSEMFTVAEKDKIYSLFFIQKLIHSPMIIPSLPLPQVVYELCSEVALQSKPISSHKGRKLKKVKIEVPTFKKAMLSISCIETIKKCCCDPPAMRWKIKGKTTESDSDQIPALCKMKMAGTQYWKIRIEQFPEEMKTAVIFGETWNADVLQSCGVRIGLYLGLSDEAGHQAGADSSNGVPLPSTLACVMERWAGLSIGQQCANHGISGPIETVFRTCQPQKPGQVVSSEDLEPEMHDHLLKNLVLRLAFKKLTGFDNQNLQVAEEI
ncbi:hypothetical protein L345_04533, partial [Ophiophagus hannah]